MTPRLVNRGGAGSHRRCTGKIGHSWTAAFHAALAVLLLGVVPARAQHVDWLLGSGGLQTAAQPPPGFYYSNQASYYWANKDSSVRRLTSSASLDAFIDFNTFLWISPWKIFGATYGADVTVPLVNTNGALDLAVLGGRAGLRRGSSQFGLSSIYVEPINLGWHLPRYDITASFGFFAPAGSYDPNRVINTGLGRWAEIGSLGAVAYLDDRRDWYVNGWVRYLTHQSQQGIDLRVGDDLITEWGAGRQFTTQIGLVSAGVVGYAYWQVTNMTGSVIPAGEINRRGSVYALGPEINATTKFGRYFFRFYSEFGAANTPQGNIIMLGVTL